MGQRLVVTITNKEKEIAKLYYHWSAYSVSALREVKKIVDCIYDHEDETEKELLLKLIRFCEANGGGIDGKEEEYKYIQSLYPDQEFVKEGYSRNNGLIALSENGMKDLQDWSEGDINIDLDEDMIYNGVYNYYATLEEYNEECLECNDDFEPLSIIDVPNIDYDLSAISVEELDGLINELMEINDYVVRNGYEIFQLIA